VDGPDPRTAAKLARAAGCRVVASHRLHDGTVAHELGCHSHAAKVRFLDLLAEWDSLQPDVRRTAEQICRGSRHQLDQIAALHRMVRDGVLHTDEPRETFTAPMYVLRNGVGDCDDTARLLLALLRSLGLSGRLGTLGSPPRHVAAQVQLAGAWWWLETTIDAEPGEHPLDAAKRLGITTRGDLE